MDIATAGMGALAAINPLSVLGPIGSGVLSWLGQNSANETNVQIAQEATRANMAMASMQMGFQERMSNTAYQRATADMRAAGINPMVAYQQGGASTPSGASGSAVSAHVESGLAKGVQSAVEATRLANEFRSADAEISLRKASEKTQEAIAQRETQSAKEAGLRAKVLERQLPAIEAESRVRAKEAGINETMVPGDAIINRVGKIGGIATDALVLKRLLSSPRKGGHGKMSEETKRLYDAGADGVPVGGGRILE